MTEQIVDIGLKLANQLDSVAVYPIADAVGIQSDFIRLYIVFLAQYPMGWIMHYFIHGTVARHLYAIVLGALIQLYMYGYEVSHVLLMSGVAYAMMLVLPRNL